MQIRRILLSGTVIAAMALTASCERASQAGQETNTPAEQAKAPDEAHGTATLALSVAEQTPSEVVVELRHQPRAGDPLPRMMELHLSLSDNLSLVSATKGPAAEAVAKDLVVLEKDGHVLRTVLFSAQNLERLGEGVLARYRLKRGDSGPARVEILNKMPVFAPPEANKGLLLAEPLEIAAP